MFCEKCGVSLNEGARFCPSCGSKVEENTSLNAVSSNESKVEMTQSGELLYDEFSDKWDWFPQESVSWIRNQMKKCDTITANKVLDCGISNPSSVLGISWIFSIVSGIFALIGYSIHYKYEHRLDGVNYYNLSDADQALYSFISSRGYPDEVFFFFFCAIVINVIACTYFKKKCGKVLISVWEIKDTVRKTNLLKFQEAVNLKFRP